MKKISIMSWISLVFIVLIILLVIGSTIFGIYGGVDGFEWILVILYVSSMVIIPYYIIIFIISLICDRKVKNKIIIKNIILSLLLILPIVFYISKFIFIK